MDFTEASQELIKHAGQSVSPEMLARIECTVLSKGAWPSPRVRIAFYVVMGQMAAFFEPVEGYTDV